MVTKPPISISTLMRPSTSSAMLRLAVRPASFRPGIAQTCPHCLRVYRSFTTVPQRSYSAKRLLMTETVSAHRTEALHSNPPPPRNIGVPESSIAGGLQSDSAARWTAHNTKSLPKGSRAILPEQEAQNSFPSPQQSSQSATRPRSRLRARKAPMTLTPSAVEHVRELLNSPDPKLIRVGVKNKGCSGSAYHLEYVDEPGKFDELVEQDGVRVLIDSKALIKVIGSEMDWVEDKLSARFTFSNPNIKEQCGCGESFSVG